ncbi:DUF2550 domain-containing protein [Mariniluteicoccus flavus]
MDWAGAVELVGLALVLLVLIPVIALFARRRWLSRQGGMFECSLRLNKAIPGAGWSLGVARYNGEHLEWFPAFSLGFRPRVRLRRTATAAIDTRDPRDAEAVLLYQGQRIVELRTIQDFGDPEEWELAMDAGSVTGLLSWLEAAPPSVGRFRS